MKSRKKHGPGKGCFGGSMKGKNKRTGGIGKSKANISMKVTAGHKLWRRIFENGIAIASRKDRFDRSRGIHITKGKVA